MQGLEIVMDIDTLEVNEVGQHVLKSALNEI